MNQNETDDKVDKPEKDHNKSKKTQKKRMRKWTNPRRITAQNSRQLSNHIEQQLQWGAPGSWHRNGSVPRMTGKSQGRC